MPAIVGRLLLDRFHECTNLLLRLGGTKRRLAIFSNVPDSSSHFTHCACRTGRLCSVKANVFTSPIRFTAAEQQYARVLTLSRKNCTWKPSIRSCGSSAPYVLATSSRRTSSK